MDSQGKIVSDRLRFGRFEVRPSERRLLVDGVPASLGSRAFDVLMALIERRDRVVDKNELLDLVWAGMVVEENNLHVQVNTLRKLLGPHAIATVSGRGYRLTLGPPDEAEPVSFDLPGDALPQPLTRFVGRESELEALGRLLGTSRLVSLTGIGGSGKTRLAIELGRRMAQRYPDGVRFADLTPVNNPDRVALEIARAAGVVEERNRTIEEALIKQLSGRRMLMIFDNCEHVLDVCAVLLDSLLMRSEYLQAIVTSREAIGVKGEQVFAVRPLSLPVPAAGVETTLDSEAARLFVDRAQLVVPGFALTEQNVSGVAEICRRLDGIPLALELAAARLRVLSVDEIRDKLGDRFRLLTAGSHAISRHQTLQAALQWSYEHLTRPEQSLLRRLSVFSGGWTLEAAAAVAESNDDEIDVVDRLSRLVDKSLVTVERQHAGSTRYGMLETVRQYAQDRLHERGDAASAHDAHLAYFLRFARGACARLPMHFVESIERIDVEVSNLLAAHAWCEQPHVPVEQGLELAARLRRYWLERGKFWLGLQVFDEALRRRGAERPTAHRADALFSRGQHLEAAGRHMEAVTPLTEALAIARKHDLRSLQSCCLARLAYAGVALGRLSEANTHIEQAIDLAGALETSEPLCLALDVLGQVRRHEGRFDDAAAALVQAIRTLPPSDLGNIHVFRRHLAQAMIAQGRLDQARKQLIECFQMARNLNAPFDAQSDLEVAARLAASNDDWSRAAWIQGAADAAADRLGVARNAWDDPYLATLLEKPRAALGAAAYETAWTTGSALNLPNALDEVLAWLTDPTAVMKEALATPR
jgi:predicted ATPase/DNA-binding winged helix-turn-helix (wHTH) protein